MEQVKINKIAIWIILLIFILVLGFFWFKQYQIYQTKSQVESINEILKTNIWNRDNCKIILNFDKTLINNKEDKFFIENKYDKLRESCDLKYNIVNAKIKEAFCKNIIKNNKSDFTDKYIILDNFSDIRNKCVSKFLKVEFGTWAFFDIDQDFKSSVNIDFSLDFFEDKYEVDSEDFINNRIKAKQKLIDLLEIEPKLELNIENIVLYKKRAILNLDLKPETKYSFKLKSIDFWVWEKVKTKIFVLNVPENKFFGFKINKKVTLFSDTNQPKFTFYKYNSNKKEAKIKICRIDNESYAKIEVYDDFPNRKFRNNFFKNWIDKIKSSQCKTKIINLNSPLEGENAWKSEGENLIKQEFDFSKEIWERARSWLYYVTFENSEDREYNSRTQKPIFFGIIDSHITMKLWANKSAFFFVNDFSGKPLANQEIRVYLNNFKSKKSNREYVDWKYVDKTIYYSPMDKKVLWEPIYLWKTNSKWILNINLKDKIKDSFERTLNSWDYSWDWNLNSLFVTSASKTNLSYVSSKHNWWISAWNFGYSVGSWWYGTRSENRDEITLQKWWENKELLSHIFTDRKLYLPNEQVNIKAILRNSEDLSIPKNKKINLIIRDPKSKEILNTDLVIWEYGSINKTIKLNKNSSLWNYFIELKLWEKRIWNSGFSVEIFKNPKFKTDVILKTEGLNWELVKISETKTENQYGWEEKQYLWDFKIKANILTKYYSGPSVKNANFKYKIYKQYYYDNSYWDDCYYGCYWEPEKEFYSEWKWILDDNWMASFEVPVKFKSDYSDYKYIVEVTVTDKAWDIISSSNSIVAKLPSEYKRWDPNSWIKFETEKRFYKSWEKIEIKWSLKHWKFSEFYNDKFLLIIKKKDYENKQILDIRWKKVNKILSKEKIEKILKVNDTNFTITPNWKVILNYEVKTSWEYVFEYWKINKNYFLNSDDIISEFGKNNNLFIEKKLEKKLEVNWENYDNLKKYCFWEKDECNKKNILKQLWCKKDYIDNSCRNKKVNIKLPIKIKVDDLIDVDSRKYFTIISYWDLSAKNPIVNDNKIWVLTEKISYHIWEKARILIRLPSSNWKILLTTEKKWVVSSELLPVKSNIFFKEFNIDDSFSPNTYIWVVFIPTPHLASPEGEEYEIPEYKVWYTEIVVDKTDKKAFININSNKKTYKPREKVTLNIDVKNKSGKWIKSELTVMVIDDSLISLMWNVDLNSLEKFYKKLPFRIQTSITNIAMLRNYYFSRKWIVGGSWFGNFKGWDSTISSRNIFKNTAFYDANVITDWNWKAKVEFNLPDNLTNFRVMVVANSAKNFFGMWQDFLEVRKNVIVQDKTPFILRNWDISKIWAQVFNNTKKTIWFKVELETSDAEVRNKTQKISIWAGKSKFVSWEIVATNNIEKIDYSIKALWDNKENSDKLEWKILVKSSPVLITNLIKNIKINWATWKYGIWNLNINIPNNTDLDKSKVEVIFSNNRFSGIEKIVSSLAKYPYWCLEQTISSTLPNAVILKFSNIFGDLIENKKQAKNNLEAWIKRLESMQLESGWFAYWQGESYETSLKINAYVLSAMLEFKKVYSSKVLNKLIENNIKYLEKEILLEKKNNISNSDKIEIFYALSKAWKSMKIEINSDKLNIYDLLKYTYWLYYSDKNIFKSEIKNNLIILKKLFDDNIQKENNYYSNIINEKAIFAKLLIEWNYDNTYSEELISDLHSKNWSNYYFSTKTKANVFLSFANYLEKNSINKVNKFGFSIWTNLNKWKIFNVWSKKVITKFEYNLSDLLIKWENEFDFKVANLSKWNLYASIILKQYPKDILKIKPYSNKVNISRNIYEVLDENMLDKCNNYWNYNYRSYSKEFKFSCDNALKQVMNNTYKKWNLYMVKIKVNFNDSGNREDFVIEDYLAWTFRIINSKFKTEWAMLKQNQNNWSWDHIEYRPDVVMAHNKYIWGDSREFSYFIRPEFTWIYTQPPVTGYFMYNPIYRWNNWFNVIEVK